MTQEGQGNVPKPIQDEIAAEYKLSETMERLAREAELTALEYHKKATWHFLRAQRLQANEWAA